MSGIELLPIAAFLVGLAGSTHCFGMCGGIAGSLSLAPRGASLRQPLLRNLLVNAGRVTSYGLAGAAVGGLGSLAGGFGSEALEIGDGLRWLSATLLAGIAIVLLANRRLPAPLERAGQAIWRRISPALRFCLPVTTKGRAFAAGMVWGFLPCGLVYAQLALAATSGSAFNGATVMIAFGLGTAVALTGLGSLFSWLGLKRMPVRATGALLLIFAVWIVQPWGWGGESAEHRHHAEAKPVSLEGH